MQKKLRLFKLFLGLGCLSALDVQTSETMSLDEARKIFGVSESVSLKDLKSAYRRLAKEFHPDLGGSNVAFRQVNEAYEHLKNAQPKPISSTFNHYEKSSDYNTKFHDTESKANYKNYSQRSTYNTRTYYTHYSQPKPVKTLKFHVHVPSMIIFGTSLIAGASFYLYKKIQARKIEQARKKEQEEAVAALELKKSQSFKHSFNKRFSSAGAFVSNHKVATGLGLAAVAGLTYVAYNKGLFGKVAKQLNLKKTDLKK